MKTPSASVILLTFLLGSQPAQAGSLISNWSQVVGQVLSRMPVLDDLGEKILANRVVFIGASDPQFTKARVKIDLGSVANVRERPSAHDGSRVITQLQPGDHLQVIARAVGQSWFQVRLSDGRIAYIHQNLIEVE